MRNGLLFIMMFAISIFAVACGGNNSATGNGAAATGGDTAGPAADVWALYKKDGRTWTHAMQGDMKMKTTIKNVKADSADMEVQMYGADGKEMGAANTTTIKFETPKVEATTAAAPAAKEPKKQNVEVKAGKFDCISHDDGKTWMMEKFPGVIVKSDAMELVEFKE